MKIHKNEYLGNIYTIVDLSSKSTNVLTYTTAL